MDQKHNCREFSEWFENWKKAGTKTAASGTGVQIGSHLVATYGPLRQFLDLQNMLRRNPSTFPPRTDASLGAKAEGANELGLSPEDISSSLDDPVEVGSGLSNLGHGADCNAQTVTDVNADSAISALQTGEMKPDTRKTFWERLVEAWGSRGLPVSQLGIAKELDMSQGSVGRWARDEGLPELEVLRGLAIKGDVCVEWLLTGRGPKRPLPVDEETNELLEYWRRLDANNRHHVRVTARNALAAQGRNPLPVAPVETFPAESPEK